MANYREKLSHIKAFVFDIDGVLSLLTINLNNNGIPCRTVNLRDGYAIQLAIKLGYKIGIISGSNSVDYIPRLTGLGVPKEDIYLNSKSKMESYYTFKEKYGLSDSEIMYMGDDIPDMEVMKIVGVPVCPSDAASDIKAISSYISHKNGGEGCVRDVIEQTLRLHDNWMKADAYVW
ncbi:MAG: HAD hydrolase family protein [Bacteroidales bacterium]|nr:HAD hydrolase family protein [Bacteroidales bacterium]